MLNYQIALTNVPFDNAYTNVRYFKNRQEQEGYFNVNTLFVNAINVNFNVGNLLKTTITFNAEDQQLNRLLSCNYLIVKNNSNVKDFDYFYYFINNSFQLSGNQISLDIELDVINTYLLDIEFTDCLIKRGHLNRFVENEDGTVSFDGTGQSKLFEREPIQNVAKRLSKKEQFTIYPDERSTSTFNEWLKENICAWIYLFISNPIQRIFFVDTTERDGILSSPEYNFFDGRANVSAGENSISPLGVLALPIYKRNSKKLYVNIKNDNYSINNKISITLSALEGYRAKNTNNSYIYASKLSYISPFDVGAYSPAYYTIDSNGDLILTGWYDEISGVKYQGANVCGIAQTTTASGGTAKGCLYVIETGKTENAGIFESNAKFNFNKNEIIGASKNSMFNPKLLSSDYHSIKIVDNTEEGFEYDLQKLNTNSLKILYNETIVPDVTKGYARFETNSVCYPKESSKNLIGTIFSNDQSLLVDNDKLAEMLANNKNFFIQNDIKSAFGLIASSLGIAGGIATGNPLAVAGGIAGAGASIGSSIDKLALTPDNMRNAPNTIRGALGNAPFSASYNNYGLSVEEYEILDNEKEMINDFMCQYGFTVNRLGNIKDFLDIRKYYNYVQAEIEEITSNKTLISNQVKNKFVEIFRRGIRFWNTNDYSYNKENYEKWLEA